ncbi:MAG: DUF3267 domain-containing protein [Cyclobacteriaceae bacterium]|nr:DUF3267 domain-containing protein [Cyclobacteriaceae bacterium]
MKSQEQTFKHIIKKEVTMGAGEANIYALVFLIPIIIVLAIPYYYIWSEQFTMEKIEEYLEARDAWTYIDIAIGMVILLISIITHELLHGLGWSIYAKNGRKSIKFGVNWKFLTPYCHCKEPLLLNKYRFGSVLPAIILGIIPSIIAIITGHLGLMAFGFFFTFAAGGDFLILWLLRNENSTDFVQDHADKIGCFIIRQEYKDL